jgi:hypothetical protein
LRLLRFAAAFLL